MVALFAILVIGLIELFKVVLEAREKTFDLRAKARESAGVLLVRALAVTTLLSITYVYDSNFLRLHQPRPPHFSNAHQCIERGSDPSLEALRRDQGEDAGQAENAAPRRRTQRVRGAPQARPMEWLLNRDTINYLTVRSRRGEFTSWTLLGQKTSELMSFKARMNPVIIFLAIPALLYCAYSAWRWRDSGRFRWPGSWEPSGRSWPPTWPAFPGPVLSTTWSLCCPASTWRSPSYFREKVAPIYVPALALSAITCFWIYYPFRTWAGV